ncbi:MAG: uridine kinase, partial [candidate division Zixibacteria bacterium]|nr:uridine kinase [candidate division Zixibacteria bacterium]
QGYYHDSFNYDMLRSSLLTPLGPVGDGQYVQAGFDFRTDAEVVSEKKSAPDGAILLFDGVFLLRPELIECWDFSLFVDVGFDVSVQRAAQRDQHLFGSADDVRARYFNRYVPGQRLYLQQAQPKSRADVIVNNNIPEDASIVRGRRRPTDSD